MTMRTSRAFQGPAARMQQYFTQMTRSSHGDGIVADCLYMLQLRTIINQLPYSLTCHGLAVDKYSNIGK
jgi:hypothetical protein